MVDEERYICPNCKTPNISDEPVAICAMCGYVPEIELGEEWQKLLANEKVRINKQEVNNDVETLC